jgi:calcineurin-like phosphoesterase family protein
MSAPVAGGVKETKSTLMCRGLLGLALGTALALGLTGPGRSGEAGEEIRLSFGLVSDVQYCDRAPAGSRFYRESAKKLATCVEDLNGQELAFTIHLGDIIDAHSACLDEVLPIYERLSMPHFHVLGNHDFAVEPELKPSIPQKLGLTSRYYDFSRAGMRFVVLDGGDVSLYAHREGSERHARAAARLAGLQAAGAPNAQAWNGGVGPKQLRWLKTTLADARSAGEKAIVFCHFPVYPPDQHNLWNDTEVVEALEASGAVVAYINGHNHAGGHAVKNGIHYLTVQGMVETEDSTAYAVVRVGDDRLEIDGRGRQPHQVLEFGAPDTP